MQGIKVLLVDDDVYLRDLIRRALTRAGAEVCEASDGVEAVDRFFQCHPDLVILDIMMPTQDGWETCRQIRQHSSVPVVMLTSLSSDEEIIRGLEYGADDFVIKPVNVQVLLARARAVLRRVEPETAFPLVYQDSHLKVDLESSLVSVAGVQTKLSPTEFRLLSYMLRNAGRLLTFNQILQNVWGEAYQDSPNYVHVYISHLRQKIETDPKSPQYILSEHGAGYRFKRLAQA
ncbi:MAG: response regulator transcription factor [Chloroflexota bacterium]